MTKVIFEYGCIPEPGGSFGQLAKAWNALHNDVSQARKAYDGRMAALSVYADNDPHAQVDRTHARDELEKLIGEARERAKGPLYAALDAIQAAADAQTGTAPTPEQVRTLETLNLRTTITRAELDELAAGMRDSPMAYAALRDVAADRFGMGLGEEHVPDAERRADAVKRLRTAVEDMLAYRGGTRTEIIAAEMMRRNAARWGGGDAGNGSPVLDLRAGGADVADVNPRYVGQMVSELLPDAPERIIRQLDGQKA